LVWASININSINSIAKLTMANSKQVWPFVKLTDFEARTTATLSILGSQYLLLYPRVTQENRKTWEEYTQQVENLDWFISQLAKGC
jgi:hypothetical protein